MELEIDAMRWKERFPNAGIKVEDAYSALEKIRHNNDGKLSPEDIVNAAKSKRHVLHKLFTWDDSVAAHKYRLYEAGSLIRSIEIVYKDVPAQHRRAFEITQQKTRGDSESKTLYTTAQEAAADPDNHSALIAEAVRTLMAWRKRFAYLQELSKFLEQVDKVIEQLADDK